MVCLVQGSIISSSICTARSLRVDFHALLSFLQCVALLGCERAVMHAVVASEKGVVVGRLSFREDGDLIDCQRMGVGGKAIPPNVDKVSSQVN